MFTAASYSRAFMMETLFCISSLQVLGSGQSYCVNKIELMHFYMNWKILLHAVFVDVDI